MLFDRFRLIFRSPSLIKFTKNPKTKNSCHSCGIFVVDQRQTSMWRAEWDQKTPLILKVQRVHLQCRQDAGVQDNPENKATLKRKPNSIRSSARIQRGIRRTYQNDKMP
ncbi:hypothetical protein ILYODFUR_015349 [Ilyodon furcidens]|uniref:Uncharacterized protein n=1 Tax=Ilyodon furcidens TaxID=33524 RepID=A0ABV0TWF8_9TELE